MSREIMGLHGLAPDHNRLSIIAKFADEVSFQLVYRKGLLSFQFQDLTL